MKKFEYMRVHVISQERQAIIYSHSIYIARIYKEDIVNAHLSIWKSYIGHLSSYLQIKTQTLV